jgi:hypothetical protein
MKPIWFLQMRKPALATLFLSAFSSLNAMPPSENTVMSCLASQATDSSIVVKSITPQDVIEQDDYSDGFDAPYTFEYEGGDVGYARNKTDQALVFEGKLYKLSSAQPDGNNHGIKPVDFAPTLAEWNIVKEAQAQFLCITFNLEGLGQSGSFQDVHGGYLLNTKNHELFFVVRDIRKSANTQRNMPKDVAVFVQERDTCDTLRGDLSDLHAPNDPDVQRTIAQTNEACRGTDRALTALKAKYSSNAEIMQKLNKYEVRIEARSEN